MSPGTIPRAVFTEGSTMRHVIVMTAAPLSPGTIPRAVFTEGSTMRHVIVMTAAS